MGEDWVEGLGLVLAASNALVALVSKPTPKPEQNLRK